MKGIIGCDADWLQPGEIIDTPDGRHLTVLRRVTLDEALESGERMGVKVEPVANEIWYEVDVQVTVTRAMNN